jgi:hypothetical protein
MKTLKITEAQAKELYNDSSASLKKLLEEHFGKLAFKEKTSRRVDTNRR